MNFSKAIGIIVVLLTVGFLLFESNRQAKPTGVLSSSTSSSIPSPFGKTGDWKLYPNPSLTPGDVLPNVTSQEVCTPGYSSSVRNVPVSEKEQVYAEYGIAYPEAQGSYEVDHFISLELGGSNDINNLWPEPAEPRPGFHEKDEVENYLHEQVCTGRETLQQAQQEIRSDWYSVYRRLNP